MDATRSFAPLLMVVILAFVVPLLLSRLKRFSLPIVVGEILAGILVGRSGLHWVTPDDPVLNLLSQFGFVFLMFLSGMEVDFHTLRGIKNNTSARRRWGPAAIGGLTFLLTLLLAIALSFVLQLAHVTRNPWMMALILSTTSLGVVVPVLKETKFNSQPLGQTILLAAVIADFGTMFLITLLVAVVSHGLAAEILLVTLLFLAFFLMVRFGVFLNRIKPVRRTIEQLSHTTAQIKVRAAFTTMLVFVVLSEALGTEIILGAFLAGAIVSVLRTADDYELCHQLEAIGFGFFIPIFFIMVGVEFNLPALLSSTAALLLVPVLVASAIGVKILPALIFRLNHSWRETLAAGALLSARLSLIIAAAAIGKRLGIIGEPVTAAIVLLAVLTVTAAPLVFVRLMPGRGAGGLRPIVVVGASELGLQVAEHLRLHHDSVVVIDSEKTLIERARQLGFDVAHARADRQDPAAAPHLEGARALICTYDDKETKYRVCNLARNTYGIDPVVAQVSDTNELARFKQLGVATMNPAFDRAALLVLLARNPALYALISRTDDDKEVWEVTVQKGQFVGRTLRELELPGDVLVLALRRDGELLVPHGNTRLNRDDRLALVGSLEHVEEARRLFD